MPDNYVAGSFAEALKKAKRTLPQYMRNFTDATSRELKDNVADRTPVDTGELKRSIEVIPTTRRFTSSGVQVWRGGAKSDLERASYTEDDTAPHIIRAKNAPYLVFFYRKLGRVVHRYQVFHPGTRGAHMFLRGAIATEANIDTRAEAMLTRWKQRSGL